VPPLQHSYLPHVVIAGVVNAGKPSSGGGASFLFFPLKPATFSSSFSKDSCALRAKPCGGHIAFDTIWWSRWSGCKRWQANRTQTHARARAHTHTHTRMHTHITVRVTVTARAGSRPGPCCTLARFMAVWFGSMAVWFGSMAVWFGSMAVWSGSRSNSSTLQSESPPASPY
jgi:hypothetical protein